LRVNNVILIGNATRDTELRLTYVGKCAPRRLEVDGAGSESLASFAGREARLLKG
jgi:single-stranded DNA-binding protein